jgi:hypothetical protein
LVESPKKLDLKEADKRSELQGLLDRIIEHAYSKFTNRFTKNVERLQWGRLITQAAKISNEILRDDELTDLVCRVQLLEEQFKSR